MKLSASPFDPHTGALLPAYRDAYLRGDLSGQAAWAVEEYLRHDDRQAEGTLTRWHQLQAQEQPEAAPGWVQRQLRLIRTEPQRFRRRAAGIVAGAALLGGAVFAGTTLPDRGPYPETLPTPVEAGAAAPAAEAAALRMVTVRGRILDENGRPLVGATVLQKGTQQGVSTDASGSYSMRVPAGQGTALLFGYGGYEDEEMTVSTAARTASVTLLPRAQKHRWLFF